MFCSKCGAANDDTATICVACNNSFIPIAPTGFQADRAKAQVKEAMNDAWATFRALGIDPVGGLLEAYKGLGIARALGVGIAFGAVFAICFVIAAYRIPYLSMASNLNGFGGFMKLFIVGIVPFVGLTIACFVGEQIGNGRGTIASDCFISGVALLPLGVVTLIASLVGIGNIEVIGTLSIVAVCLNILILFAGLTRIGCVSEKVASLAVPMMLIASVWISKVIYVSMFF